MIELYSLNFSWGEIKQILIYTTGVKALFVCASAFKHLEKLTDH
jgi:hypothetical protein